MSRNNCPEEIAAAHADQRTEMVMQHLVRRGIADQRVLDAMGDVPREEFVPQQFLKAAYEDGPLPIGHQQTISQPYTVAFMCEALKLNGTENVLEVGTGSGYAAAVLSRLARQVHTIERISELAAAAQSRLERLGIDNVVVHSGDGSVGFPDAAPYDAILVSAGAPELPHVLVDQLAEGGRIVLPVGPRVHQQMCRFTRIGDDLSREPLGPFTFVPLIGAAGWDGDSL